MKKITFFLYLCSLCGVYGQIPPYVPTNGLVAYYPFNGNANDESGNGNNGTNSGAILTIDRYGNFNSAFNFNGIDNVITVQDNNSIHANIFTLSAWINGNDYNGFKQVICKNFGNQNNESINLVINNNAQWNLTAQVGGQGYYGTLINSPNSISVQQWHHIVYSFNDDQNIQQLFIDGILVANNIALNSVEYDNKPLTIGAQLEFNNLQYFFKGSIDDIGFWNRNLTQQEITNLYYADTTCQSLVINTGFLSFNPPTYQNTVTIYPNPANDQITIDCGNLANVSGWNIKITNMLGQEVFNQPMNTQQYVVPLNTWSGQGIYFVKIYDASNNLMNTKKIILQ
ncbi:MAG: LamG-like jellyroll fold domain-containing protein [Flavobacterium sp.]|uniref:LamG-like jellyroll fold domain-containing protein n=1 Tax=Flavobacterium sp. TaxID=239 RepID=UPI003BDAC98A